MAGQKNGEEGYVLGWVIIMVMILMILVTSILFASSAYYRQSFREYNDRQAYLTARSIVQTAAADFTGGGSGELRDVILDELSELMGDDSDARLPIPEIKFQLDSTMGTCTLNGSFMPDENCLMLTATAKKGGSTELMTVYLQHNPESEEEPWTVLGYERGKIKKGGK